MLTSPTQDHAGAGDPAPFGAVRSDVHGRARAVRFAIVAGVLPVLAAVATQFSSHRTLFFAGAAGGCAALIIVSTLTRRLRPLFWLAEFGGIVAFTLMQAHTGGVASSYSLLVLIAMMWLGLQATLGELVVRKLRQDALIDDLTGLLNRRGWRYIAAPEFERAARTRKPVALVTIDLDHFKEQNDEFGHDHGDRVLRSTAERMQATFRAGDILARLGGDEFVVLLSNSTLEGALAAARRLREITPVEADLSAGIAVWDGSEDLGELMYRSDRALYAAKSSGGGQTHVAVRGRHEYVAAEAS
jgi:diguanylate cyclase (GGDEF)-like protein